MSAGWDEEQWCALRRQSARDILAANSPDRQWRVIHRASRRVLQHFSSSFFIVTRFLPPAKRNQVEVIYAAVRYPDEIVDTFPLAAEERLQSLDSWAGDYERGLQCPSLYDAVAAELDCFAAAFAQVVRACEIPHEHYRAFLDAMRMDARPRSFRDLEDLIESYVYGSAVVVGYFLAYVYGASAPAEFPRALRGSRSLGIALQLTNFLRDVREDKRRGRVYLPADILRTHGVSLDNPDYSSSAPNLRAVLRELSAVAEQHYSDAERSLEAFAPDCRVAIQACIDVYRQLNARIGRSPLGILHRESVPPGDKFRVLPLSKYWRLPLAYLGAI